MTEIRFYHLQQDTTTRAVPDILGKAVEKGLKVLLKLPNDERVAFYDDWLWRFSPESFLPHGKTGDKSPELQPIWLDTADAAPNRARMALVVEEAEMPPLGDFDLICLIFDSENLDRLKRARSLWGELKQTPDLALTYWKQNENGGWAKQNV